MKAHKKVNNKNKEIINKLIMINNGNKNIETQNKIQEKRKGQRALMKKIIINKII